MARSSTTRHGTGAGWGGPAKGASKSRLKPRGDAESDRIRREQNSKSAPIVQRREAVAEEMRQVLYDLALKAEAETVRANAADKLLDRLEGKPVQKQDVTSGGEKLAGITVISGVERAGD